MSEYPRITYQTSERTFDRLFKEQSLDETKDVVRKKLELGNDAPVELAQLRDGRRIDLEDDDDFEAFKALAKTSLHATVAVIVREKGHSSSNRAEKHAPVKRKNRPDRPEHGVPESARSDTEPSRVQAPDTSPPRKKRKVAFDGDLVSSVASQPSQRSASKDTGSPSRELPLSSVHDSISGALAPPPSKPATSRPSSEAEIAGSSTQAPKEKPRNPKRKIAKVTPPEDDPANLAEDHAHTSRKKKIKGTPSRKESLPKPGALNADDVNPSSDTQKKRFRKGQTEIPVEDNTIPTGTVSPSIGDGSSQAGIEVFNPDKPKKTKIGKRKSGSADAAESSVMKSKTGSVDTAKEPTKPLKKKASKKKVGPEVSKAGDDDDIDKTIAAFLTQRQQAHSSDIWGLVSTREIAVRVDDPPPKTTRKSKQVKPRARNTHVSSAASVEAVETNVPERSTRKADQRTSIHNGPSASLNPVELNGHVAAISVEETAADSRSSTSEHHHTSVEPPKSEIISKLVSGNSIHRLAGSPIAQERPGSVGVHTARMEKGPGLAPSSEAVVPHCHFAEKARSTSPDSGSDSVARSSPMSALATTSTSFSKVDSIAEATPTIPKGLEISEVPIEAHGEGSSSDSSTESEDEWNKLAGVVASINTSPGPVDLEDQLTALIHGPTKRGPCKSILDEVPSSSEAGDESNSEALILDEEEDLSKQPSYKRVRALSTIRPSSIEPEDTSEDEEDAPVPIYMDTSHEVSDHPRKLPAVNGGTGNHVSINVGAEASEQPEVDTYLAQPPEARDQDQSIAPQTVPVDATAPPSQPGTRLPGPASLELDATAINTEPSKFPVQASSDPQTSEVLVPASSSVIDGPATSTKKVQPQDMNDEVESAVEPHGGDSESDPIEQECTQPNQPASSQGIGSAPRDLHRRTSRTASNPPVLEQPSRRSHRLANRRYSTSGAALVPLSQIRSKMSMALEKATSSAMDSNWIRDIAEEATREKSVRKGVRKSRNKRTRSTAQQSGDSGDETSPSVAREDGSPRAPLSSQAKWTTLPPSDHSPPDASSVIDELRTSSQGSLEKPPQDEDKSSRSGDEKTVPGSTQGVTIPSRVKKGGTQPLFFPGSSQVPRAPSASPSESEHESKMMLSKKTPIRTPRSGSHLRRLTELASSGTLFSKSKAAQRRFKNTPSSVVTQPRFDASDDGEDDEESSSSSDDAVMSFHIPKERRAGAARKKKGQGLLSLISY